MDASKITITEPNGGYKELNQSERVSLRQELALALIRKKPYGTVIKSREFAHAMNMSEQGAWAFINKLVKQGVITRHEISARLSSYVVNEPQVVIKPVVGEAPANPTPPPHEPDRHRSRDYFGRLRQRVRLDTQLRLTTRFRAVDGWKRTKNAASRRER